MLHCVLHSPDPTLTVENVVGVMEKVTTVGRGKVLSKLLGVDLVTDISSKCSNEKEMLLMNSDVYVNYFVDSSWEELARVLYKELETAAVEEVRSYLNPRGRLLQLVGVVCD